MDTVYGYLGRNESWLESAADTVWKRSKKKGKQTRDDLIAAIVYAKKSNTSPKERTEIRHIMKYDSERMTKNKWQAYLRCAMLNLSEPGPLSAVKYVKKLWLTEYYWKKLESEDSFDYSLDLDSDLSGLPEASGLPSTKKEAKKALRERKRKPSWFS